jgi:hypothetical protein
MKVQNVRSINFDTHGTCYTVCAKYSDKHPWCVDKCLEKMRNVRNSWLNVLEMSEKSGALILILTGHVYKCNKCPRDVRNIQINIAGVWINVVNNMGNVWSTTGM